MKSFPKEKRAIPLGLKPEVLLGAIMLDQVVCTILRDPFFVVQITSCVEGKHKRSSLHRFGYAVDTNVSKHLSDEEVKNVIETFNGRATPDYDLILEYRGQPREHLHLEFDVRDYIFTGE